MHKHAFTSSFANIANFASVAVVAACVALIGGATGCTHCIDDEDDDLEDNDSAVEAGTLSDGQSIDATVADCDADFFAFDIDASQALTVIFTALDASTSQPEEARSGELHVDLQRADGSVVQPFFDDPATADDDADAAAAEAHVTITNVDPEDTASERIVQVDVDAGTFDGTAMIAVVQDGYADNLFPVVSTYSLRATRVTP